MKLIENRLVGESAFENAVLRSLVMMELMNLGGDADFYEVSADEPGETGIMAAKAEGGCVSLACEAWFEVEPAYPDPRPEHFERGEFLLMFKWRTPEREGSWFELIEYMKFKLSEYDKKYGVEETTPSTAHGRELRLLTP